MSDTLADLAAWLPSDFLSGDLDNNHNISKTLFHNNPAVLFPCEFGSCSSTESESDDDDVTGLTRRFTRSVSLQERIQMTHPLEKMRGYSGSPESTLNWGVTGPTQVRSTPATPFGQRDEDSWERIYAAAGQIAMMKMKMKMMRMNQLQQPNDDDVLAHQLLLGAPPPMGPTTPHHYNHHEELVMQLRFRRSVSASGAGNFNGGGGGQCGVNQPLGFRQSAWPVENQRRQVTANGFVPKHVSGCYGSGPPFAKKECAGTGVFLPRRYCPEPPEVKKTQACSPGFVPTRVVAQSYNKNMNIVDPTIVTNPQQPNIHGIFGPHFAQQNIDAQRAELLMAKRNMVMLAQQHQQHQQQQQRRSTAYVEANEVVLPQEWTY
ncbi:hypothetical protein CTI12_AA059740 [Artemisia annua]|uniref:Uncharacterized protein n=1 Tax=Artemisia annua TaxID=35608 RepID=A0A2U1Q979_ARTAN|nr:hypothetical protein CTI12_AA059740 [Artemisia annua]